MNKIKNLLSKSIQCDLVNKGFGEMSLLWPLVSDFKHQYLVFDTTSVVSHVDSIVRFPILDISV